MTVNTFTIVISTSKNFKGSQKKKYIIEIREAAHTCSIHTNAQLIPTSVCESAQANPPGAGLVTHRRLYHVSQMKVWVPEAPGPSSVMADMARYPLMIQLGGLFPS